MKFRWMRNLVACGAVVIASSALFGQGSSNCLPVGGMLMTNLGAVDASTTMGPVTGDLKGAVGVTILGQTVQNGGATLAFTVQHHWVTDSGAMVSFQPATATVSQVSANSPLYGVSSYSAQITGGTGKFAGATGNLSFIGEADLSTGELVFRYRGTICFAHQPAE